MCKLIGKWTLKRDEEKQNYEEYSMENDYYLNSFIVLLLDFIMTFCFFLSFKFDFLCSGSYKVICEFMSMLGKIRLQKTMLITSPTKFVLWYYDSMILYRTCYI